VLGTRHSGSQAEDSASLREIHSFRRRRAQQTRHVSEIETGELRRRIASGDARLTVEALMPDDVQLLGWSGGPTHLDNIARQLERVPAGETDYLVVRADDTMVCKGGIDFTKEPGAGIIWQVATHPSLEGLGLATTLIRELEDRAAGRNLPTVGLAVELDNDRARRLYEHLGYRPVGESEESWISDRPDGSSYLYRTTVTLMSKQL
jgi:ribosomal protein S18 acetylase RimI-like enzyme